MICNSSERTRLCLIQNDHITFFPQEKQENNTARSPRGQVEVSVSVIPPLNSPSSPLLPPPPPPSPFLWQREPVWLPRKQAFPWRCWNTWEGQGSFVSPVMKDSPHACLIARLMVPNPTAEPIYHSLIMFNGASDTLILPVLSRCAAPTVAAFAIVALWSWWVQRRPQIVRPNKKGTHVPSVVTDIHMDK